MSLSLAGHDLSFILNNHGKVVSDKEVHVECDPLSDLIYIDAGEVIGEVHADASHSCNEKPIHTSVNQGVGRGFELVAVKADGKDKDHQVEDLSRSEAVGEPHVPAHVIVAVKVADAWAANEGY